MRGSLGGSASAATTPVLSRAGMPGEVLMTTAIEGYKYRRLGAFARGWWLAALCAALALLSGGARAADRTPFDHFTTGFELLGQHRDLPCESCHVNAIFKGTPRACAASHAVATTGAAPPNPATPILPPT